MHFIPTWKVVKEQNVWSKETLKCSSHLDVRKKERERESCLGATNAANHLLSRNDQKASTSEQTKTDCETTCVYIVQVWQFTQCACARCNSHCRTVPIMKHYDTSASPMKWSEAERKKDSRDWTADTANKHTWRSVSTDDYFIALVGADPCLTMK